MAGAGFRFRSAGKQSRLRLPAGEPLKGLTTGRHQVLGASPSGPRCLFRHKSACKTAKKLHSVHMHLLASLEILIGVSTILKKQTEAMSYMEFPEVEGLAVGNRLSTNETALTFCELAAWRAWRPMMAAAFLQGHVVQGHVACCAPSGYSPWLTHIIFWYNCHTLKDDTCGECCICIWHQRL